MRQERQYSVLCAVCICIPGDFSIPSPSCSIGGKGILCLVAMCLDRVSVNSV